jgi:ABC-type dipeptide/oligopeptide/nickel transport system ATPase component
MAMIGMPPEPNGRIAGGRVSFRGLDLLNREARAVVGKRIGFIFQDPAASLDPCYTIGAQITETICAHEDIHKAAARERALELLSLVGIADPPSAYTAYPHQFSGGMQQRAMFAIALSCRPEFLIGDNPTSALDVTIQAQILRLISDLRSRLGLTVFWITNNFGVVAKLCDRVAVMYAGAILEIGKVGDVLRHPSHPYTRRLLASSGMSSARSGPLPGVLPSSASASGEEGGRFATQCPTIMTAI